MRDMVLVVPPFECAWLMGEEERFAEAGRGCVSFEARADNDVTIVFKEQAGCKHYRTDSGPSYTVVLGSHRNRRFKIEVDGKTVVDVPAIILQPTSFERYWISLHYGLISVGKGNPGEGVVYEWTDSEPNCNIQYVGLSSWDKHVCYRDVHVLPPLPPSKTEHDIGLISLANYLENAELSDLQLVVGPEKRVIPAHQILFDLCSIQYHGAALSEGTLHLPSVEYPLMRAMLEYIYTGHTQVLERQVVTFQEMAEEFGFQILATECQRLQDALRMSSDDEPCNPNAERKVDIVFQRRDNLDNCPPFLMGLPVAVQNLPNLLEDQVHTDVELSVDGHEKLIRAHKLVLGSWSIPFAKMFTNGMFESSSNEVLIKDVCPEPFLAMIHFMYKGHLDVSGQEDLGLLLLHLLLLADQFQINLLQQKCCDYLCENVNEDSACTVLQFAQCIPACQALRDVCETVCAKNFDYCCAPPSLEFRQLEVACLERILKHPDLWVTSEEKVLDAVMLWVINQEDVCGWEDASLCMDAVDGGPLTVKQLDDLKTLLPLVGFPLLPLPVLQKLQSSSLSKHIPLLKDLAKEAIEYLEQRGSAIRPPRVDMRSQGRFVILPRATLRFTPRLPTYKELLYISAGDQNGVFYYIGTSFGLHPWMNPVLSKKLVVTASSPPSRFTDGKTLVSGNYQGTSFAGPYNEDGFISSWWKVDLGEKHRLMCNYYTVRQDGSTNFMRDWSLQGSNDGKHWSELRTHHNEQTVCRPGQYASWPVSGACAYDPYRFFRIVLVGPTTNTSYPWNFSLCYLELYGYFQ